MEVDGPIHDPSLVIRILRIVLVAERVADNPFADGTVDPGDVPGLGLGLLEGLAIEGEGYDAVLRNDVFMALDELLSYPGPYTPGTLAGLLLAPELVAGGALPLTAGAGMPKGSAFVEAVIFLV